MNELQIFSNPEFGSIRTLDEDGKVLFAATDVAKALGYSNPHDAISKHCKGVAKREALTNGGVQELNFIPEGAASGLYSTGAASGDYSTAEVSGKDSIAVANGYNSKARGASGCYIVLTEYDVDGHMICAKMARVDGSAIRENVYYTLKNGEFVEAEP